MATITISSTSVTDYKGSTTDATLRIYSSLSFYDDSSVHHVKGAVGSNLFYQEIECSVAAGVITIPAFTLNSTTNISTALTYTAVLYDQRGREINRHLTSFRVPVTPTTTTWEVLEEYKVQYRPPFTADYWTTDQTLAAFDSYIGQVVVPEATDAARGTTKLSVGTGDDGAVGVLDATYQTSKQRKYYSDYASLSAALTDIGSDATEFVLNNDFTVSTNTTIPGNVSLIFSPSTLLTINNGVTLTIENGAGLQANPTQQIFNCIGTGKPYFNKSLPAKIYPDWFGARGDNVTDDSAAFAKLYTLYPPTGSGTFFLNTGKTYYQGTTPFEPDIPFHLTAEPAADYFNPSANMRWGTNSKGIIPHHNSTKTGIADGRSALGSRISNIGILGNESDFVATHTVNLSGLTITKTAGTDLTGANGYAHGYTITINNVEYYIETGGSTTTVTVQKPRIYGIGFVGTPYIIRGDYAAWATNGEWDGQNIEIGGNTYTIASVDFGNILNRTDIDYITLTAPITETSNSSNFSYAPVFSDVNTGSDTITVTGHVMTTGMAVYFEAYGTAPNPLVTGTTYYVIRVDANTIKLATSYANAIANTAINLTTQGTVNFAFTALTYLDTMEIQTLATLNGLPARFNIFNGVTVKATSTIEHCKIWNWAGHGIAGDSTTGLSAFVATVPNCNNSSFRRNTLYYNRGSGIAMVGVNGNQSYIENNDSTNNHGAGFDDSSFLGNTWVGNHTSFNYFASHWTDGASNRAAFINEYTEGGQPSCKFVQNTLRLHGNYASGISTASTGGDIKHEDGITRMENLQILADPNFATKKCGVKLSVRQQPNTMLGFGATEETANTGGGGTLNSLVVPTYQLGYDQLATGVYHLYYGGQYTNPNDTVLAFGGSNSALPGKLVLPTGFRTGVSDSHITKVLRGSVTIDAASVSANTVADQTFTLAGAATGDTLILNPPTTALTAGMLVSQAHVSAANTITIRFYNTTGSPIDLASATWNYTLIRS